MVGIDNRCHDVATEGGTNLIEQVVVVKLCLGIVVGTNLQFGAVGGQSAGERRRHARTEVATDDGGTHQTNLRLLLLEEVDEDVGVRCRRIGEESLAVEDEEFVNAVGQYLLFHLPLDARTGHHGMQFDTQLIGQLASFGEQLLRHFGHHGALHFDIYKNVLHGFIL